jgi:hypothetical protein
MEENDFIGQFDEKEMTSLWVAILTEKVGNFLI